MTISITKAELASTAVRSAIGTRQIQTALTTEGEEQPGGIINLVWRGLGSLGGFLLDAVKGVIRIGLSFTALAGLIIQARDFIWNFNFNVSDTQLDRQMRAQWANYGSFLGGIVGNAAGWVACGAIPGAAIFAFKPAIGAYVLREVGEEALSELAANVSALIQTSIRSFSQSLFIWSFKNLRRSIKRLNQAQGEKLFGPRWSQLIEQWGAENGPVLSFAQNLEDRVEAIPNDFWQQFIEEGIDEFSDACTEAIFVVANALDSYLAMQKLTQQNQLGAERTLELIPNRARESESIILSGPEEVIKPAITSALATSQLVENRDIGQFVGDSVEDYARRLREGITLKFVLYNRPFPPYSQKGREGITKATITILNAKRSAVDWEKMRFACGGANGYIWGPHRANGTLSDGSTTKLYAGTEAEAEDRLIAFWNLSELDLKQITPAHEKKSGERLTNPKLYKEPTRIYPAYVTIITRQRQVAIDQGRASLQGNFIDRQDRFELWRAKEPANFQSRVQELLRYAT